MSLRDWMLVVLLSLVWGGSFFFAEIALRAFGPLSVVALRVSIAAAILLAFMRLRGIPVPTGLEAWTGLAVTTSRGDWAEARVGACGGAVGTRWASGKRRIR